MRDYKIAVIGLGYVGLPLALEFGGHFEVLGYDINRQRVRELARGTDKTCETDPVLLKKLKRETAGGKGVYFTSDITAAKSCNIYIITVPTPVDRFKAPDLRYLLTATEAVGGLLKKGDIVIYESTVYPGCTEEECVPVLEQSSELKFNEDFFCGYSPERINPGDKVNTLATIRKVTSGSTEAIAQEVDDLYALIIKAGTYKASSIKVAEASKAIENAQRDLNISFMNELALIFDRMGIDTTDVLEAAATKWNFLKYRPGLVGGHCIGVDPYYLTHKAEALGYYPQVILSGRRVNDTMGTFIAGKIIKLMIGKGAVIKGGRCLMLGFAFKENCPDTRNTRVMDVYAELQQFGLDIDVCDPWIDRDAVYEEYGIKVNPGIRTEKYDCIILTVAHRQFLDLDTDLLKAPGGVVFDTRSVWDRSKVDGRL